MHILYLGPARVDMLEFLQSFGDTIETKEDVITVDDVNGIDFLISYGYRHIIKKDIIAILKNKAINLHISLLPWNRGADPNFWSFAEDTPHGVSIHLIEAGLDTGAIFAQANVEMRNDDTLRSSHERLSTNIEKLFKEKWPYIRNGQITAIPQTGDGSYHRMADKEKFMHHLIPDGWDTPVEKIKGIAR